MSDSAVLWLNFHISFSYSYSYSYSYLYFIFLILFLHIWKRYEEKVEKYAKSTLLCVAASHTGKVTPSKPRPLDAALPCTTTLPRTFPLNWFGRQIFSIFCFCRIPFLFVIELLYVSSYRTDILRYFCANPHLNLTLTNRTNREYFFFHKECAQFNAVQSNVLKLFSALC